MARTVVPGARHWPLAALLLASVLWAPPSWPAAVLLGLLEPPLAYLGETFGLSMTSAIDGAIISGLGSTLVVILAALVLGETISRAGIIAAEVLRGRPLSVRWRGLPASRDARSGGPAGPAGPGGPASPLDGLPVFLPGC